MEKGGWGSTLGATGEAGSASGGGGGGGGQPFGEAETPSTVSPRTMELQQQQQQQQHRRGVHFGGSFYSSSDSSVSASSSRKFYAETTPSSGGGGGGGGWSYLGGAGGASRQSSRGSFGSEGQPPAAGGSASKHSSRGSFGSEGGRSDAGYGRLNARQQQLQPPLPDKKKQRQQQEQLRQLQLQLLHQQHRHDDERQQRRRREGSPSEDKLAPPPPPPPAHGDEYGAVPSDYLSRGGDADGSAEPTTTGSGSGRRDGGGGPAGGARETERRGLEAGISSRASPSPRIRAMAGGGGGTAGFGSSISAFLPGSRGSSAAAASAGFAAGGDDVCGAESGDRGPGRGEWGERLPSAATAAAMRTMDSSGSRPRSARQTSTGLVSHVSLLANLGIDAGRICVAGSRVLLSFAQPLSQPLLFFPTFAASGTRTPCAGDHLLRSELSGAWRDSPARVLAAQREH